MLLMDVNPLALGLNTKLIGTTCVVIERNTPIPVKKTLTFFTSRDNQTSVFFKVVEGKTSLMPLSKYHPGDANSTTPYIYSTDKVKSSKKKLSFKKILIILVNSIRLKLGLC